MEDDLLWKMTFNARPPTTFIGKKLHIERFRDSALPYTAVAVIFKRGMTFAVFHKVEKWAWVRERLTTSVRAGTSWSAATFKTYESILSVQQVFVFFRVFYNF